MNNIKKHRYFRPSDSERIAILRRERRMMLRLIASLERLVGRKEKEDGRKTTESSH